MTEFTVSKAERTASGGLKNDILFSLNNLLDGELDFDRLRATQNDADSLESLAELSAQLEPLAGESTRSNRMQLFDNAASSPINQSFHDLMGYANQSHFSASFGSEEGVASLEEELLASKDNFDVPDWCRKLTFFELSELNHELEDLKTQVTEMEEKIARNSSMIAEFDEMSKALLSLSESCIRQGSCKVFETLGWTVKLSDTNPEEILLADGDVVQAIVYVTSSTGFPSRTGLSRLAESIVNYWVKTDIEPKGIFLANTFAEQEPNDRNTNCFCGHFNDFAQRKNLCLLTCVQLLTLFKQLIKGGKEPAEIRTEIVSTSGKLCDPLVAPLVAPSQHELLC